MGNSVTQSRRKNILVVQAKRASISDILTTRTGRQNFSTAQTLAGHIPSVEDILESQAPAEDIIIKCSPEEMTKSFFQDYVIVWYDPNVSSQENQQYFAQLKKFCDVLTFTEWQKAKDFIQTSPTACHVVTSGTNGELLVKEIVSCQNVANIYIFCQNIEYHSNWAKKYDCKVSTNIESVLSQIQQNLLSWYQQASSLKLNLPAFAPIFNEADKSQMNNLHRFLKVIPNFQNRLQAKNDFLSLSKIIYSDPKNTKLIADFEQNYNTYDKEQTLRWYSQESFLYKVTNNCLRIATSDSIQYCRLLLQDIQKAIKEQYQTKSKSFNGLLYRGAYLSETEWLSLKTNLNREIEMHGFLSVSKVKNIGLNFMKIDPSKKALITIIVPKGPNEEEQGFAEMQEFSEYPQEKEILFNVRSRFTILETEDDGPYRHLVLLYGAQGFRKYMTEQNPILEVKVEPVSCHQCKIARGDKIFFISLLDPQKQIYFCEKCIDNDFAPFLYIPPTKKDKVKIQGFLLNNSSHSELPFYGYKCSSSEKCQGTKQKHSFTQYFTCTNCNIQWCQSCFEKNPLHCNQAQHNILLETTPFSFWYSQMSPNESRHIKYQNDLLTNSGHTFQQAQMYFESQLYEKAIEYFSIYVQQNQEDSSNLAISYNNLGFIFQKQGDDKKALEYYFKSLEISKSVYGDDHSDIIPTYFNIGYVYDNQKNFAKALEYYFKSVEIATSTHEDNNPDIATAYSNIGMVYNHQGEYNKALEYYFKSLDISKSVYGDDHPDLATLYQNIGVVFNYQREYEKALEYYFKALEMQKSVYGDNHPDLVMPYNNIGLAFFYLGEFPKALEYLFKSVKICKSVGGDNHPDLAVFYRNIASVFETQAEYAKALEYNLKGLEIQKLVHGDNHSGNAITYNNIGLTFFHQGDYKKALEYYFRALDIYNAVSGASPPEMATLCSNIGSAYTQQGEYKKALKYYFKSFGINKSVYGGDNHPEIANNYIDIGTAFYLQGEDKKTLEYFFKALDITKSVFGDSHPQTIDIQKRIFFVQSTQIDS